MSVRLKMNSNNNNIEAVHLQLKVKGHSLKNVNVSIVDRHGFFYSSFCLLCVHCGQPCLNRRGSVNSLQCWDRFPGPSSYVHIWDPRQTLAYTVLLFCGKRTQYCKDIYVLLLKYTPVSSAEDGRPSCDERGHSWGVWQHVAKMLTTREACRSGHNRYKCRYNSFLYLIPAATTL